MSHTANTHAATQAPAATAAATRAAAKDAAEDQLKLLLLLASDWHDNDRTHADEIAELIVALTPLPPPPTEP